MRDYDAVRCEVDNGLLRAKVDCQSKPITFTVTTVHEPADASMLAHGIDVIGLRPRRSIFADVFAGRLRRLAKL